MTTELFYLFLSSILLSVLWIPYIIGLVQSDGPDTPEDYKNLRAHLELPAWVRRANRAHVNMVEQFGAFAGVVVVAHLANVSTATTAIAAAVFFWARVVHAFIMIAGVSQFRARTMTFTVAFLAILVIGFEIARSAV